MMICSVCGAVGAEFHFGGYSCRACAAFFRRFVHSRKRSIVCNCAKRTQTSHPCRRCRMEKCLAAGLDKQKVQPAREKNQSIQSSSGNESPPAFSLTDCQIVSRECSKIEQTVSKWAFVDAERRRVYGDNAETLNFYEVSCCTKTDGMIIWQMVEGLFPELTKLKSSDKEALLSNFMSKFFVIESSFEFSWFKEPWKYLEDTEENARLLSNFYGGAMTEKHKMSNADILRIFQPYWTYYYSQIIIPIYKKRSDMFEFIAQFFLVLFDHAYLNISEECAKHCRALRNLILRELKGYQTDKNHDEMRFFDTLENLVLIEKAEEKFQEELQVCELYNVKLHDDFRRMVITDKL